MTNPTIQAARDIIAEVATIATELGREERERLGRDLTESEAANLADMVMRQLQTAIAVSRR